jgi:cytochrome c oxidase subunit 2
MEFQFADALIFGFGGLLLAVIFLSVARSARGAPVPYEQVAARGYRIRNYWFYLLLVAAIVALATTLPRLPYESARLAGYGPNANPLVVQVKGQQWAWLMQPATFAHGQVVEFRVTSSDVNHDFGIYNPDGQIVGQVQAMPGYTNVLVMRFDQPGSYQIRCLELCGQYHHLMVRGFEVT